MVVPTDDTVEVHEMTASDGTGHEDSPERPFVTSKSDGDAVAKTNERLVHIEDETKLTDDFHSDEVLSCETTQQSQPLHKDTTASPFMNSDTGLSGKVSSDERDNTRHLSILTRQKTERTLSRSDSSFWDDTSGDLISVDSSRMRTQWSCENPSPSRTTQRSLYRRPRSQPGKDSSGDWMAAAFAVGCTKTNWAGEEIGFMDLLRAIFGRARELDRLAIKYEGADETHRTVLSNHSNALSVPPFHYSNIPLRSFYCSAFCCTKLGAGRVGNMVVLWQRWEPFDEDEELASGDESERELDHAAKVNSKKPTRSYRPRLMCVLGPYWPVTIFFTVPFLVCLSVWATYKAVLSLNWYVTGASLILNTSLFLALFLVSCRDPGILYRHNTAPVSTEPDQEGGSQQGKNVSHRNDDAWTWNDQAQTYRPPHAKYDPECAVVVENFDHVCPVVGTAVGSKNRAAFILFIIFAVITITFDIVLLATLRD